MRITSMQKKELELHLHYVLREDNIHQMNAKVHNDCERFFLQALDVLKSYTGDFNVEIKVPKEGGIINEFILSLTPDFADLINIIITAFITHYFTKKANKTQDVLNLVEIIEKIKENKLTKEEALAVVAGDKKLRRIVSNYYKEIEKEPQVICIETSTNSFEEIAEFVRIEKPDFQTHIIETDSVEDTKTIEGTTIAILSPILQKGHGKIWNGIYSGKTISFKIEDSDFLGQVYNNEIKFGSATVIKCKLQIKRKETRTEGDLQLKEEFEYVVKDVLTWEDDVHFQSETRRYKKIKAEKQQLAFDFEQDNKE